MAAGTARWPGRRVHYWLFAIWSVASIGGCVKQQFSRSYFVFDVFPYVVIWAAVYVLLAAVLPIVATFRGSWRAGIRAFVESIAFLLVTLAVMFGVQWTFHALGLGHWPPRDAVYARIFRERHEEWTAERDRILGEAKADAADPVKIAAARNDPYRLGYHYAGRGRFEELGADMAAVADDATWIKFIFHEGQIHREPIQEKGLFFATPELLARSDTRWVDHLTVENLGDGWFVYEQH